MTTLYYAPKACSLAPHILLEEVGLPYRAELVDIFADAHRRPEYLALNPRARVPALVLPDGEVLTEVIALVTWVAEQAPEHELVPRDPLARARCYELLSFIASRVHPAFGQAVRPDRYSPDPADHARISAHGVRAFAASLELLDGMLVADPYALGARFSAADAHALVFALCARHVGLDPARFPRLGRTMTVTLERPAVRRVIEAEGLVEYAYAR